MDKKNLWLAAACGAVLTTLLSNLPFIGLINILRFAAFWGSAIFTVWLYRRLSGAVTVGQGLKLGALTGLSALRRAAISSPCSTTVRKNPTPSPAPRPSCVSTPG